MWFFRFLRKFGTHPGFWTLLALAAIGIGMLVPIAAPALVVAAMAMLVLTFMTAAWTYVLKNQRSIKQFSDRDDKVKWIARCIDAFFSNHICQGIVLVVGMLVFIAALVLTIGALTGGAGFAFMLPVFAALSAPFAAAAAAGGISLFLPALVGFVFVLASLNLTNILKNILAWFDSFKEDAVVVDLKNKNMPISEWNKDGRRVAVNNYFYAHDRPGDSMFRLYFSTVATGIAEVVKRGGNSPAEAVSAGEPIPDEVTFGKPQKML